VQQGVSKHVEVALKLAQHRSHAQALDDCGTSDAATGSAGSRTAGSQQDEVRLMCLLTIACCLSTLLHRCFRC
jgi:hypothetical protein